MGDRRADRSWFELVKSITIAMLADPSRLPGLIAILTDQSAEATTYVYVRQAPAGVPADLRTMTADQLRRVVLAQFDGPTIGLAAIDQIRPDLVTKGHAFVRLDRILRRYGNVAVLRASWLELADYLAEHPAETVADEDTQRRTAAEIAGIRAPALLGQLPAERLRRLIAFRPDTGEALCLGDCSLDELCERVLPPDDELITFEEIRVLVEAGAPASQRERFPIELRTILHRAHLDGPAGEWLSETLGALAQAFYQRWLDHGDVADRDSAYAIAVERWLANRDVDDLVAVVPGDDFASFVSQGAGTYVYRRSLEYRNYSASRPGRHLSLYDAVDTLARPDSPVVFAILPLRELCATSATWLDLGPPLRRSGRTEILARNAWLFVQDWLDADDPATWRQLKVSLASLYETMVRCCAIFSLTDPWRTRQGRRDEWVHESYRTLNEVIGRRRAESSAPAYHTALDTWYSCARETTDVQAAMKDIVDLLSRVPNGTWPAAVADDVERLKTVARGLRELLRGGARAEAYASLSGPPMASLPLVVRHITDMAQPMGLLSEPFGASFRHYARLHERLRRLKTGTMPASYNARSLADVAAELRRSQQLIFAPQHEDRILRALYSRAIDEAGELTRGDAILEVDLRTTEIAMEEPSRIVFVVRNVGRLAAHDIEFELVAADTFDLEEPTFKRVLPVLVANAQAQFEFTVTSTVEEVELSVQCIVTWARVEQPDYAQAGDAPERERRDRTWDVEVIRRSSREFTVKPNPYVFGVHVENHRAFFGRRAELIRLLEHVASDTPQSVVLQAPRRAGKTSLLRMVWATLTDTDRNRSVRDWFDLPAAWDDGLNRTVPVWLNLQNSPELMSELNASGFYRQILGAMVHAGLGTARAESALREKVVPYAHFERALEDIVDAAGNRRLVILVDEFDVLSDIPDKLTFYSTLRSVVEQIQDITWIIVSAMGLYDDIREYGSPLFNIFRIVRMGWMDTNAARHVVTGPFEPEGAHAEANLRYLGDAVDMILEETGNYPYYIQMLCSEIISYVNEIKTNRVSIDTVGRAVLRMLDANTAEHSLDFMWDHAGAAGQVILLSLLTSDLPMPHNQLWDAARQLLADHSRADLTGRLNAQFSPALERLTYIDALRHVPGAGYAFSVPIFRQALVRRIERVDPTQAAVDQLVEEGSGPRRG
jgi:hypothetical protein